MRNTFEKAKQYTGDAFQTQAAAVEKYLYEMHLRNTGQKYFSEIQLRNRAKLLEGDAIEDAFQNPK